MFTNLYLNLFWKGRKYIGPDKEIRITRTYEKYGDKVYDIVWCLRDKRKNCKNRLKPETITERCNARSIREVIRQVEKNDLPKAIKQFQEKMKK